VHDNDPKFGSHVCPDRLRALGAHLVPQPPQSPDLNPIEHVWSALKSALERSQPTALKGLQDRSRASGIGCPILPAKLVESMPHRLSALRRAKGGPTSTKNGWA